MRLQLIVLSVCIVAVTGRRGMSQPKPQDPFWNKYPYGWGLDIEDPKHEEEEYEKMKEVKRVTSRPKTPKEQVMKKPGWFHRSPEHHTKFLNVEDALNGSLE